MSEEKAKDCLFTSKAFQPKIGWSPNSKGEGVKKILCLVKHQVRFEPGTFKLTYAHTPMQPIQE